MRFEVTLNEYNGLTVALQPEPIGFTGSVEQVTKDHRRVHF
jgi:hypothetical protein